MNEHGPTVVKIGGSTLGAEDTTLDDVVALQRAGTRPVVVHGGGAEIDAWLKRLQVGTEFVDGLRVTTEAALEVVLAVLRGVVNTRLVAALQARGARAVGLSGVDGGLLAAARYDQRLGFVGRVTQVETALVEAALAAGAVPVIAPIGLEPPAQPLNVNADTAAGEVASALRAARLVFLTDVDGLLSAEGEVLPRVSREQVEALRAAGTVSGGMIPKLEACFRAADAAVAACIVNGRQPRTLMRVVDGAALGTRIGG